MILPPRPRFALLALAATGLMVVVPARADSSALPLAMQGAELPAYLQCVPYAREVSGIQIYGDAHTWWQQAAGRFDRGNTPRVGAVMAFMPHRNMRLGHVAAVSRVIDSRTVLIDHANWSPIDGRRGQIERDVKAIDVSPNNDWSQVRVWYHPLQALGVTPWPVHGFIYPDEARSTPRRFAVATRPPVQAATASVSDDFRNAFSSLPPRRAVAQGAAPRPAPRATQRVSFETLSRDYSQARPLPPRQQQRERVADPAARALALYE